MHPRLQPYGEGGGFQGLFPASPPPPPPTSICVDSEKDLDDQGMLGILL